MTAMAAALSASGAMAENVTPVAQTTESDYPLAREMQIIEETQQRALATCHQDYLARVAELQTVIDSSGVKDRAALIAIIEDMGAPEGNMDDRPDQDLMMAGGSMVGTNKAICESDAYQASTESFQALSQVLADNIASLRAERASLQDILIILEALEGFATGNAPVLQEINAIKQDTLRMREELSDLDASSARYREEIAASKARVEAIWADIASDA